MDIELGMSGYGQVSTHSSVPFDNLLGPIHIPPELDIGCLVAES